MRTFWSSLVVCLTMSVGSAAQRPAQPLENARRGLGASGEIAGLRA